MGRFCSAVQPSDTSQLSDSEVERIVDLAVFALAVGAQGSPQGAPEREYGNMLRLTQATLHAGRSEFWDSPGEASWGEWTQTLIWSLTDVIDTSCHPTSPSRDAAPEYEHYASLTEQITSCGHGLLTTCLQVLTLFAPANRSTA
jgi:hypothetical protein